MEEQIIVTLTTWAPRVYNLPRVIESILANTIVPDKIILNISREEFPDGFPNILPDAVEINFVSKNTKAWKKIIPTLKRFPKDCIICIDDDMIYPKNFIETLVKAHLRHPNNPISLVDVVRFGAHQHCGHGTLDKAEYYGEMLNQRIPEEYRSTDTWFNYWAQKSGHPVIWCGEELTTTSYNDVEPLSVAPKRDKQNMWDYCVNTFGPIRSSVTNIYYTVPFDTAKNIGKYYNDFAKVVPDDAYICFIDADTIFTTPDYGQLIAEVVNKHPQVDAFTCYTNRIGCSWQIAPGSDWENDDMKYHREFGKNLKEQYGTQCLDVTYNKCMSGHFMLIKKSTWKAMGGCSEFGMLGIDNEIHKKIRRIGGTIYLMQGLYVYHWYRGGDKTDKAHLL